MTDKNAEITQNNTPALPNHICIIPNGNRTWAREHGLPETEGHNVGVEVLAKLTRYMRKRGVHTASVWASSTENLKNRAPTEIKNLARLLKYSIEKWASEAHEEGARLIYLGRKEGIPQNIIKIVTEWEEKTKNNTAHTLNLAFNYGGHDELLRAMQKAFADIAAGKITFNDLYKTDGMYHGKYPYLYFKNYLDTQDQPHPYPDLIIRSSGEQRLSGWMPWQSVYAEFCSINKYFPDFTEDTIDFAIAEYQKRRRTFGGNA